MKILGVLDIVAAILLVATIKITLPSVLVYVFAGYLILKGLCFIKDIASIVDIITGIALLAALGGNLPIGLIFILAGFLGIKGIMTCLAN
jgi:hypothetical protein